MTYQRPHIPVSDRIGSRRQRRTWVVTLYGAFVAANLAYAATEHNPSHVLRAVGLAAVLVAFGLGGWAFWMLMRRTLVNAPNISDDDLDERFRDRGRDATRRAYFSLAALTCCVPFYVEVATTAERWPLLRNATLIADLSWALFLLALTLPTAIMAWTEPDPIAD